MFKNPGNFRSDVTRCSYCTYRIKDNYKEFIRKYTFEDSEFESTKRELLKKSKYFHMSRICALANVDYYSFNLWKNKGIFVLTPKEIDALYDAISHVCK